jgi:iron complex outermembrane recepter protein
MLKVQRKARFLLGVSSLMVAFPAHAVGAQAVDPTVQSDPAASPDIAAQPDVAASDDQDQGEIVVTGTLIPGIAPVGTNVLTMNREDIIATGAASANDLLTRTPQVSSAFLSTPTVSSSDSGLSLIRPNIRDLGASGTNTTLVLADGHRLVGAGVLQSTPDPDVIPPAVLERVDIVPDGGSSIYGSDAIGGVINYITRKRFDGIEASGHYGFANNYQAVDLNILAGKDWGSGSAYAAYTWADNDAILGKDRDFMRQITPNQGYCPPGTITANGTTYALPGRTPGTMTDCDVTDNNTYWPATTRHSVFASLNQDLAHNVTVDVRGYYTRRNITNFMDLTAVMPQTLTVTNANPFFQPIGTETQQTINTSFQGVLDNRLRNRLTSFGVSPSLTAQLGGSWQLRLLTNYGRSNTVTRTIQINPAAALASTNPATALNPYDLGSNSEAVLDSIYNESSEFAKQRLLNARAVLDGPLFRLPGGEVRLAAGAEYLKEKHVATTVTGARSASRDVKAIFGEIVLPVVGDDNSMTGIQSLTFSASGRYDDYSVLGGTFNPKVGVTYEPLSGVKVRANWGESFNAPSIVDATGVVAAGGLPSGAFSVPGQTSPWAVIIAGNTGSEMRPQTAQTWSLGVDIRPQAIPGLNLSATYYNLKLKDVIGLLFGAPVLPELEPFIRENVPCAEALAQFGSATSFLVPLPTVCALSPTVALYDYRVQNLGIIKQDGIDFNFFYDRPVSFGSIRLGLAGTYTLNRDVARVPGAPFIEQLDTPGRSRLSFVASAGAQVGDLNALASLNHRGGYDLNPPIPATNRFGAQDHVGSFTTVDLFFDYKLPQHWLRDVSITLNINNLFDQDPPFYNSCLGTTTCGFTNGSTLGRFIQLGVRTSF